MDYMYPNDAGTSEKRADGKTSSGLPQDGKAYKLIKLNYDIVIVVRISDPELLPLPVLTTCTRSMIQHQWARGNQFLVGKNVVKRYP